MLNLVDVINIRLKISFLIPIRHDLYTKCSKIALSNVLYLYIITCISFLGDIKADNN